MGRSPTQVKLIAPLNSKCSAIRHALQVVKSKEQANFGAPYRPFGITVEGRQAIELLTVR
jgi:hypothetical protein